jgi:hypothetical protein
MKKLHALTVFSTLMLAGCGALQNLSTEDIIQPEYLRRSEVLEMTIPQIQQAFYDYSAKCTQLRQPRINPSNPKVALYVEETIGLSQANPGIVFVFTETGTTTRVDSYSYSNSFAWPGRVENIWKAIKNPKQCR